MKLFYPQAYTQSLRGNPEPSRKWWSGTPYGEFDFISTEAPAELVKDYTFTFIPGWNTMTKLFYRKILNYVKNGGEMFMSLPQFATNEDRDFLVQMESMSLLNDGDLSELCGIKVIGKGKQVKRIVSTDEGREKNYVVHSESYANHPPVYSAKIQNLNAEIIAYDENSQNPLLIKNKIGKGCIYLLTAYNYHGNTRIRHFISDFMKKRIENHAPITLDGDINDIFYAYYNERKNNIHRLYFINTDWTRKDNVKNFSFSCGDYRRVPMEFKEGLVKNVIIKDELMIQHEELFFFVSDIQKSGEQYELSLRGDKRKSFVYSFLGNEDKKDVFEIVFDDGWSKNIQIRRRD